MLRNSSLTNSGRPPAKQVPLSLAVDNGQAISDAVDQAARALGKAAALAKPQYPKIAATLERLKTEALRAFMES